MNAEENLPACRACGRTVIPWSPFTRAGIDLWYLKDSQSSLHMSCCTAQKTHFCASTREQYCRWFTRRALLLWYWDTNSRVRPIHQKANILNEYRHFGLYHLIMQMTDHIFIVESVKHWLHWTLLWTFSNKSAFIFIYVLTFVPLSKHLSASQNTFGLFHHFKEIKPKCRRWIKLTWGIRGKKGVLWHHFTNLCRQLSNEGKMPAVTSLMELRPDVQNDWRF